MNAEQRMAAAENWYNSRSKQHLIEWATAHGLDIGQNGQELDADWNERVMRAYADTLYGREA